MIYNNSLSNLCLECDNLDKIFSSIDYLNENDIILEKLDLSKIKEKIIKIIRGAIEAVKKFISMVGGWIKNIKKFIVDMFNKVIYKKLKDKENEELTDSQKEKLDQLSAENKKSISEGLALDGYFHMFGFKNTEGLNKIIAASKELSKYAITPEDIKYTYENAYKLEEYSEKLKEMSKDFKDNIHKYSLTMTYSQIELSKVKSADMFKERLSKLDKIIDQLNKIIDTFSPYVSINERMLHKISIQIDSDYDKKYKEGRDLDSYVVSNIKNMSRDEYDEYGEKSKNLYEEQTKIIKYDTAFMKYESAMSSAVISLIFIIKRNMTDINRYYRELQNIIKIILAG